MGSHTKGLLSFSRICKFAHKVWDKRGLIHVAQKDSRTFLFRLDSEISMQNALAKGTWYLDQKPMVVHAWGIKADTVKSIPLWVKFEQVPDCYWTKEGLSSLASAIGLPLGADTLTSQLEVLPFAKMCVQYKLGNDMPNKIQALTLDPYTGEKSVVDILVSYPNRPLVCVACHSLGHLVGACPRATREWVRKEKPVHHTVDVDPAPTDVEHPSGVRMQNVVLEAMDQDKNETSTGEWHTISKKKGASSAASLEESPSPLNTFKNLRKIDEVEGKKLTGTSLHTPAWTQSQMKRVKRNKGMYSPQLT